MPAKSDRPRLSSLENAVMQVVWSKQRVTGDEVRVGLARRQDLKDSTIRTILRRLEEKGYVEHDVEGRTYIYRPRIEPHSVAAQQVRGIIDRFCRGSVENLLVGMVDDNLITPDKLRDLAARIEEAEATQKKTERDKK
ncbi:MAG TPA: BlaI/MecI/CopY family transcriptional regulator [Pirellulaceae bacterium]|nr:BlaI/MecI/CopY family transcriptional regulator [Pirellulaceae bacterium]